MNGAAAREIDLPKQQNEPWLFQTMLDGFSTSELGIDYLYRILEQLTERYGLDDAVVILSHESIGTQAFRLGRQTVSPEMAAKMAAGPGVFCEPDVVPGIVCDAIRTACHLSLSLHLERLSADRDPLTTIANRRAFDAALVAAAMRSSRYGWGFTLALIDLNGVEQVDDQFGQTGSDDDSLRSFGFALRGSLRRGDVAARIGADEFAVILSNAEGHEVLGFTDRLRAQLASNGERIDFTVGTSVSPRDSTDPAELLRIADGRLQKKGPVSP